MTEIITKVKMLVMKSHTEHPEVEEVAVEIITVVTTKIDNIMPRAIKKVMVAMKSNHHTEAVAAAEEAVEVEVATEAAEEAIMITKTKSSIK